MFEVSAAVQDTIADAITSQAGAAATMAVLIVASCFMIAQVLPTHRYVAAAALRVAGMISALIAVTLGVHSQAWVAHLDTATTSWLITHRSASIDSAATVITNLGSPAATVAAAVICAALLAWRARSLLPGMVVIGTVGAATLASTALKVIVDRPRPPVQWQLVAESSSSFPSGHVTATAALLGITAVCVGTGCSRTARAGLASAVLGGALLIAATRLYLGVHWLTDVVAGAILAGVVVTLGATMLEALHGDPPPVDAGTVPPIRPPHPRAIRETALPTRRR